jgi:Tol biopolymer transport system component
VTVNNSTAGVILFPIQTGIPLFSLLIPVSDYGDTRIPAIMKNKECHSMFKQIFVFTVALTLLSCITDPPPPEEDLINLTKDYTSRMGYYCWDPGNQIIAYDPIITGYSLVNPDTKRITPIFSAKDTNLGLPVWYPDGKRFFFYIRWTYADTIPTGISYKSRDEYLVYDISKRFVTKFPMDSLLLGTDEYRFSPKGNLLAVSIEGKIYIMPDTGGTPVNVTKTYVDGVPTSMWMSWNPEGTELITAAYAIHVFNLQSRSWRKIVDREYFDKIDPYKAWTASYLDEVEWSPRGDCISFTKFPPEWMNEMQGIYIFNLRDSTLKRVTPEDRQFRRAKWSPDGKWLALAAYDGIYKKRVN